MVESSDLAFASLLVTRFDGYMDVYNAVDSEQLCEDEQRHIFQVLGDPRGFDLNLRVSAMQENLAGSTEVPNDKRPFSQYVVLQNKLLNEYQEYLVNAVGLLELEGEKSV